MPLIDRPAGWIPRPPHFQSSDASRFKRILRLLSASLLAACQGEPTTPTSPPAPVAAAPVSLLVIDNVVASLTVVPDSQMVFVGDQFKITSRPRNAAGELLSKPARWTILDTRIAKQLDSLKATVTFKALRAGTTSIKATVDGKSRSSKLVARSVTGAKVILSPAQATVVTGGTFQFTATGLTATGEKAAVNVTWTAPGNSISTAGLFKAGSATGTFKVIATSRFSKADTSIVTVTLPPNPIAKLILMPETATLESGASTTFQAYGRTQAGDSVPATVSYTATGGTVSTGGVYTAGTVSGSYRVIARTPSGLSDTSQVAISPPAVTRVTLLPDLAASRPGASTRFVTTAWTALGQSTTQATQYEATCGTIGTDGVFTAPSAPAANCRVTVSAGGKSDTTEVVFLSDSRTVGIPLGLFDLWSAPTKVPEPGLAPFSASFGNASPTTLVTHIASARAKGIRLVLTMTGGAHNRYKTDGVFDLVKWQTTMDGFNTPAIRDAVAEAVADGVIIGNSVMDEPHQASTDPNNDKSWGPPGTMTKARVDGLCGYVKNIFPTLPVGVFHDPAVLQPDSSYRVCDFLISQYATRKGSVTAWRDKGLAMGQRDQIAMMFSLNILDGGQQDKDGVWDCPNTGGLGTYAPNCRMTPEQVREWGKVLGPAGCALLSWRYDEQFMARPENQSALSDIAITLAGLPRKDCTSSRIPNLLPIAAFDASCNYLSCQFTDQSTDDGGIVSWSWDFGDGTVSSETNPAHTYAAAGSYDVTLTATDDREASQTVSRTVTVESAPPPPENSAPTAAFSSNCADLECSFLDESTDDGSVVGWSWDFGDGTSSTDREPSHHYEAEGSYEVTLVVTDDEGSSGTARQTVSVSQTQAAVAQP